MKKWPQAKKQVAEWWHKRIRNKVLVVFVALTFLVISTMYSIGRRYVATTADEPVEFGVTFVENYAQYLGVDPEETMRALIDDMGIKRFRLVSYWSDIEPTPGTYDFSSLDWQFALAEEKDVDVSLAIGLRQPRWPECHMPDWAERLPREAWYPALKEFMSATINRYKDSPTLISYQLENEFHLEVFGNCPDHDRERLIDEFNLVRSLDDTRPIIITRSNNATPSWPIGEPRADIVGAAIYKRTWDRTITKRYFEYPFPSWFYSFLAGATKLTTDRVSFIHELQAEPWLPAGFDMKSAPTAEMYKSFGPDRVKPRLDYAVDTGMSPIDLWGGEWWYYMKQVRNEPAVWNEMREALAAYD